MPVPADSARLPAPRVPLPWAMRPVVRIRVPPAGRATPPLSVMVPAVVSPSTSRLVRPAAGVGLFRLIVSPPPVPLTVTLVLLAKSIASNAGLLLLTSVVAVMPTGVPFTIFSGAAPLSVIVKVVSDTVSVVGARPVKLIVCVRPRLVLVWVMVPAWTGVLLLGA